VIFTFVENAFDELRLISDSRSKVANDEEKGEINVIKDNPTKVNARYLKFFWNFILFAPCDLGSGS
jgi:hypothetical protein